MDKNMSKWRDGLVEGWRMGGWVDKWTKGRWMGNGLMRGCWTDEQVGE